MQTVPSAKASEVSFNEGILRLAAVHARPVEFRYAKSPAAPIETRRFTPTGIGQANDGAFVVMGNDEDREQPRAFRLDRIKGDVKIP